MIFLKDKNQKTKSILLFIGLLIFCNINFLTFSKELSRNPHSNNVENEKKAFRELSPKPSYNSSHGAIYIDSNSKLDDYCSGNGTDGLSWETAHVIEDYIFKHGSDIDIYNTDRFLIIRNCTLSGCNVGIHIKSAANVKIEKCFINDSASYGINIDDSDYCIVENNIESNSDKDGIFCSGILNIIQYNYVNMSSDDGIQVSTSTTNKGNTVTENCVWDNTDQDIQDNNPSDNDVFGNYYYRYPIDTDNDDLTNFHEILTYGTDPSSIDSDGDNFLDGYEVNYSSDPLDDKDYPPIPQDWWDIINTQLEGNATLIENLISWSNGNATLLENVISQLEQNATLLQEVIGWLDGNHTQIQQLFIYLNGNATLLNTTVKNLNWNATLIQNLISWSNGNATLLKNVISQLEQNATLLQEVIGWLDGNNTQIQQLLSYIDGNATLLLDVINQLEKNATKIDMVLALANQNCDKLKSFNSSYITNVTEIWDVLDQLGISVGDLDYDGLNDLNETLIGTDLDCADTDCDNLNDAFELKYGTDPLADDTDGDGYYDGVEVAAGTNPLDENEFPGSSNENPQEPNDTEERDKNGKNISGYGISLTLMFGLIAISLILHGFLKKS